MPHRLSSLPEILAGQNIPCAIEGNAALEVAGVATLEEAGPHDISFLSNPKYEKALETTSAGAVIVSQAQAVPAGMTVLRVSDPYAALTVLMVHIYGFRRHPRVGVSRAAVIDPSARVGEGAQVHHGVTIGPDVRIGRGVVLYPGVYIAADCRLGDDCVLFPNVVLYEGSVLGNRVTLHANTVIGEDGLGYAPVGEKWHKIPQVGTVEIGDDVEIGANCSIDRATLGRTVIGPGTKFSNQIAIGHGTRVGPDCMFVAQVGIAGSVTVGRHVTMAGKVGVAGHLTIGDNAQLAAMSGVMDDVPPDSAVAGAPAMPRKEALRSWAHLARLPEMHKQLRDLEARLVELEARLNGQR
jgi:UDP-3-O-[3-hydroxymyristoyl] glucosamine N-acyltransferase